jgi:phosphopantothenoylcysteine decarboxylase/phosphopantothenate--cysteine ligase
MRIVLGVGGGIAAYKTADLARALVRKGHEVQAVLTRAAQEFVTPLTMASLTGRKVITAMFDSASPEATLSSSIEHIGVAQESDLLLIAPATANLLAEFAHGLAPDFLTTLYLAFRGPVVLAPAMNTQMWDHEATRANLEILRKRGHTIVDPDDGFLACGAYGPGRLAANEKILETVDQTLRAPLHDLAGETILITAGPTQEPIDPVRYLSNRSSGKMGYALADAAIARGARVTLVSGPVSLEPPSAASTIRVRTAEEMRAAVFANLEPATVVIKCAAVADFRPAKAASEKIKKTDAPETIALQPTPDILAELGRRKGERLLVGFAAETSNLRDYASRKLVAKNCDMIVANLVGAGKGFETDDNEVALVLPGGEFISLGHASKRQIADRILDQVKALKLTAAKLVAAR